MYSIAGGIGTLCICHVAPASVVVSRTGSRSSFLASGSPDFGSRSPPPAEHQVAVTHETDVAVATPVGSVDGDQLCPASWDTYVAPVTDDAPPTP